MGKGRGKRVEVGVSTADRAGLLREAFQSTKGESAQLFLQHELASQVENHNGETANLNEASSAQFEPFRK